MLIDSHAHLDFPSFDEDREAMLERAWQAGLEAVIQVCFNAETIERGFRLLDGHPRIWFAVGMHPQAADEFTPEMLARVDELSRHPRVVAIGEVGLDNFREYALVPNQEACFRAMVRLARERALPLVIHSRDARDETVRILREEGAGAVGGVMHCYSYDLDTALELVELGFHISFPCFVTYPKRNQHEVVRGLPLERILLETDSPFMPPQRLRGRRNEPACVADSAATIAELLGRSVEEVARITSANAVRLFRLPLVAEPLSGQEPA